MEIKKQTGLRGTLTVPGDKSISHRAVMFGALAKGTTKISHFLEGADCLSTISCFRKMGIEIEHTKEEILVRGKGLHGLISPTETLDVGNSGTTTRLISGILAGQDFSSRLDGDDSIRTRPMNRIITPLTLMGADITSQKGNGMRSAYDSWKKPSCHSLRFSGSFRSGKILRTSGRYVRRWYYQCNGTFPFQKPYRDYAELFRR